MADDRPAVRQAAALREPDGGGLVISIVKTFVIITLYR